MLLTIINESLGRNQPNNSLTAWGFQSLMKTSCIKLNTKIFQIFFDYLHKYFQPNFFLKHIIWLVDQIRRCFNMVLPQKLLRHHTDILTLISIFQKEAHPDPQSAEPAP